MADKPSKVQQKRLVFFSLLPRFQKPGARHQQTQESQLLPRYISACKCTLKIASKCEDVSHYFEFPPRKDKIITADVSQKYVRVTNTFNLKSNLLAWWMNQRNLCQTVLSFFLFICFGVQWIRIFKSFVYFLSNLLLLLTIDIMHIEL